MPVIQSTSPSWIVYKSSKHARDKQRVVLTTDEIDVFRDFDFKARILGKELEIQVGDLNEVFFEYETLDEGYVV